jgi:hypothetical protein
MHTGLQELLEIRLIHDSVLILRGFDSAAPVNVVSATGFAGNPRRLGERE